MIRVGRRAALQAMVGGTLLGVASHAWPAQSYANGKTIRLVVPFAPAGSADNAARLISDKLGQELGASVVVDNRPGGDGVVGMQHVAAAKPDGLTLLLNVSSAHTLTPTLNKAAPDPVSAFTPVALLSRIGFVLVVRDQFPARNFQEFLEYARRNQSKMSLSAGSSGVALMSEKFKKAARLPEMVIASYKGPGVAAVISGEVDATIDGFNGAAMLKAGKLRALAMASDKRNPDYPDVPTLDELGIKDMRFSSWAGVLAPAGTSPSIVDELQRAVAAVMAQDSVKARFKEFNYETVASTPSQFAAEIRNDVAQWRELVKSTGYKP